MSRSSKRELLAPAVSRAVGDVLRSPGLALVPNASRTRESIAADPVHLPVTSPGENVEREASHAESRPWAHRDFTNVRVHTDANAAQTAQALHARAFTVGNHMVFGPGEFAPHRDSGRRLLAHELAHTRQEGSENRLARAPVTGVAMNPLPIDSYSVEMGTEGGVWAGKLAETFAIDRFDDETTARFAASDEERDAVMSSVFQRKPKGAVASQKIFPVAVPEPKSSGGSRDYSIRRGFLHRRKASGKASYASHSSERYRMRRPVPGPACQLYPTGVS